MFWRDVAFLRRCLQYFGWVWHFWRGACSVLEGGDIFEAVLTVFRRGVAFLRRCLQCFGGAL